MTGEDRTSGEDPTTGEDSMRWDRPATADLAVTEVMAYIRARCPWAAGHTHVSLQRYLLEEAHELVDALDAHAAAPTPATREAVVGELGDVLYQVLFHAAMLDDPDRDPSPEALRAQPRPAEAIGEVVDVLSSKLIRRHPHVFDSDGPVAIDEVERRYEEVKAAERGSTSQAGRARGSFDSVPRTMPALARAQAVLGRMDRLGIDVDPGGASADADPEASAPVDADPDGAEIGRELFALVARAHAAGVDAEAALRGITSDMEDAAVLRAEEAADD